MKPIFFPIILFSFAAHAFDADKFDAAGKKASFAAASIHMYTDTKIKCEGKPIDTLVSKMQDIDESMVIFAEQEMDMLDMAKMFLPHYLDGADVLLNSGCYVEAEKYYKRIIRQYVGIGYAAYRQRAEIGLDEIKEEKKGFFD